MTQFDLTLPRMNSHDIAELNKRVLIKRRAVDVTVVEPITCEGRRSVLHEGDSRCPKCGERVSQ